MSPGRFQAEMNAAFGRGLWRFCVAYIDDQSPTFLFVVRRGALRTSIKGFAAGGAAPIRGKTVNVCRSPKYVDADAVYESSRFEIVEGEDLEAVWKALPRAVREEHIAVHGTGGSVLAGTASQRRAQRRARRLLITTSSSHTIWSR